jgi:diguanylate cyclase (GGDEF)-like protein
MASDRGTLRAWLRRCRAGRCSFSFAARLGVTVALTFAIVGVIAYVVLEHNFASRQVSDLAAVQRADATSFERFAARQPSTGAAVSEIDQLLDLVARRPGIKEASLIDTRHIIRASGSGHDGRFDSDRVIDAALAHGRSYAGRETDPSADRSDFEFVAPVDLHGVRFAYEVTYDHRTFDSQLAEVRTVLGLVALLALLLGGLVFYLVGGRTLLREHRLVMQRATLDGLTDLPNQRAFYDELENAVGAAERYGDSLSLALLDVDQFKLINDRNGHPHGDAVLQRVAGVLQAARPGDRAYRIGGDEFAVLMPHTDSQGAKTFARRLCRELGEAGVKTSIGVGTRRANMGADILRAETDSALYEAKRRGGHRSAHVDDIGEHATMLDPRKKDAVLRLIAEGTLSTEFQPIWDISTETLLGIEALTRPDRAYELAGPAEAFDIAEQIGRVHQLDVLCVKSALNVASELADDVLLFINLSPVTLDLDADGDDWLLAAVELAGLTPPQIVVEVTERFGGRTSSVLKCLKRLRSDGFKIAVDDVGTGNSGLEMLRKIEAEFVKIDRSIVTGASNESGARAVLMAMATFARQTGALVIAEGIEDQELLAFLRSLDDEDNHEPVIRGGQGYGLGRPAPHIPHQRPTILQHHATA